MSTGLIGLLDDVAAIAKMAAAALDDAATQAAKAGAKAAGVVIDDAAVTPRYVVGFSASRELPIVWKIAVGSLRNKFLFLLPGAMALSLFAPWAVMPLLALGGLFLCYEGAEKVLHAVIPHAAHAHEEAIGIVQADPKAAEDEKVTGAIRTDFILSAEVMAIALSSVATASLVMQATVLAVVALGITAAVYGAVAIIVKADDAGVALARNPMPATTVLGLRAAAGGASPNALDRTLHPLTSGIGRGLVLGMPHFLKLLSLVGTAAMLWVGGGIVLHALEEFGLKAPAHLIHGAAHAVGHAMPVGSAAVEWLANATLAGIVGIVLGALVIPVVERVLTPGTAAVRRMLGRAKAA